MLKKIMLIFCSAVIATQLINSAANAAQQNEWALSAINLPDLKLPGNNKTVKIALIDTGIHLDDTKILPGYNYAFSNQDTDDVIGHGTRIAGIIEYTLKNYGKSINYGLVPLVYYSQYPSGVPVNGGKKAIAKAICEAVDVYGCKIINISSGIPNDYKELKDAVEYAEKKGVIIVAAVGNGHCLEQDRLLYPAAYDTVIGVGAVDCNLNAAVFSQRNSSVMVTAPGKDLITISIRAGTESNKVSGTSYAAAYVSSYAAVLVSKYPKLTPSEFRRTLMNHSKDLGEPGYDKAFGYGLINISAGLDSIS